MQLINITNRKQLNDFIASQKMSQFLQSFEWGEFQEKVAGKIFRLGVINDDSLVVVATIVKKTLPMGKSYFYCPRGPIEQSVDISRSTQARDETAELLFNDIRKLAREEEVMFLRLEPLNELCIKDLKSQVLKTLDVQPSNTLVLDLTKLEVELLGEMHAKTRYNIKLAEKRGVIIEEAEAIRFDDFWQLMSETSERDNFRLHGINYYKNMLEVDSKYIKLYFASHNGNPISTGIFSFFGDTVTYLHGASSSVDRNVMAPYLLHWQIINLAKSQGYKYYDFNGVDEKRWPGVTRFKNGFGGSAVNYPGTFDMIFDQGWYSIYKMVRKARRTF